MSSTPHDPFYSSPFGPFYRRHTPYMVQPEYRIYEMNKRLQSRTEGGEPLNINDICVLLSMCVTVSHSVCDEKICNQVCRNFLETSFFM
ncbi:hypothetical protein FD754_019085 [Muntiacus muntjak]|uniref:Uncharacterized protein n=1 Tax=Muntiacus muntjak TaxID=9888 RepID=A0A5N3UZG4_MUNMU|nr:hypothetical protein FD754_019085 [Muntiacus muntjak]